MTAEPIDATLRQYERERAEVRSPGRTEIQAGRWLWSYAQPWVRGDGQTSLSLVRRVGRCIVATTIDVTRHMLSPEIVLESDYRLVTREGQRWLKLQVVLDDQRCRAIRATGKELDDEVDRLALAVGEAACAAEAALALCGFTAEGATP